MTRRMSDSEDPYAVSDSDEDVPKGPPPKIQIEGRTGDLTQLKTALTQTKESTKDEERLQEIQALKEKNEAKNIKQGFESGQITTKSAEDLELEKKAKQLQEQEFIAGVKENYSKFKDRFEHMDSTLEENLEEKLKSMEREKMGMGKETLLSAKERFEKGLPEDQNIEKEKVDIQLSEAEKKRRMAAFQKDMTAEDAPKDCAVCSKIVYPVERVFCNGQLYHKECFSCAKCKKKLTPHNYNLHEGILLCKVHLMEVLHPEQAVGLDPNEVEEDERESDSDDDEFAVTNKPRKMKTGVVKSGAGDISDELAQIRSMKDRKGEFEESVREAEKVEKRTLIEEDIQEGRVKANKDRFIAGTADDEKKIEREELHFEQVGDIKNKWKTGQVESAEQKEATELEELEGLKGGPSVKERFKERTEAENAPVERHWDASQLDAAPEDERKEALRAFLAFLRGKIIEEPNSTNKHVAAEARKSFLEGTAYTGGKVEKTASDLAELKFGELNAFKDRFEKGEGESSEVQKTQIEIDGISLGDIKSAFECKGRSTANMTPEERAEQKQKEIEAEFLRYKLARKAAAKRAQEQAAAGTEAVVIGGADQESGAGVGGIKDRFEGGQAFASQEAGKEGLDVEIKVAGKARAKFQQLDSSGAQPVLPKDTTKKAPSKWDKEEKPIGEVINRRDVDQVEADEDEEFDVKHLMSKFKNITDTSNKVVSSEHRAELEALQVGAKNIKQQFEKGEDSGSAVEEEKRKAMQEEFERLKKEREEMQKKLEEERLQEQAEAGEHKEEEIGIRAEHASKMAAKWEKLQQKEAKKAERGRMPQKTTVSLRIFSPPKCAVCSKAVYLAEQFQCFGLLYHTRCFRCSVCQQFLRVEKVHRSKEGVLFCATHYKLHEKKVHQTTVHNNNEGEVVSLETSTVAEEENRAIA